MRYICAMVRRPEICGLICDTLVPVIPFPLRTTFLLAIICLRISFFSRSSFNAASSVVFRLNFTKAVDWETSLFSSGLYSVLAPIMLCPSPGLEITLSRREAFFILFKELNLELLSLSYGRFSGLSAALAYKRYFLGILNPYPGILILGDGDAGDAGPIPCRLILFP